jgi:DNA-binding protein Fis
MRIFLTGATGYIGSAVLDALARTNGNQTKAAKLLGLSRRALIARLDKYGLPRPRKE